MTGIMDINNKESYNKITERWKEVRDKSPVNQCIVDFAKDIKPGGHILDIGCGTGYPIAEYLSGQGFKVTGIDVSENMIEKAVGLRLQNAKFILCDFFEFRPDEKFDGIIAFDSFFHFPQDKQAGIYPILSGWMNPHARLLFTHGKSKGEITGNMFGEEFYYGALDVGEVHKLLEDNGFSIEISTEDYKEKTTGERDLLITAKKIR